VEESQHSRSNTSPKQNSLPAGVSVAYEAIKQTVGNQWSGGMNFVAKAIA
jgi:hypothetical protein